MLMQSSLTTGCPARKRNTFAIPNIPHYGIYRESRDQAIKLAIEWFDQHLKK